MITFLEMETMIYMIDSIERKIHYFVNTYWIYM